jgi:hypothetical protein
VAADVERHRLRRCRTHLQPVEIVELAVVFDHAAAEHQLDDIDHLVDALAALCVRHPAPLEFFGRPTDPDTEAEPVVGEVRHRSNLAGQQQRVARPQLHDVGVEAQLRGHRAQCTREDQRINPGRVLIEHSLAVSGVGIVDGLLLKVKDRVRQRDVVESEFLRRLGDLDELV